MITEIPLDRFCNDIIKSELLVLAKQYPEINTTYELLEKYITIPKILAYAQKHNVLNIHDIKCQILYNVYLPQIEEKNTPNHQDD